MMELKPCPFGSENIEPAGRKPTIFCGGAYYSEVAETEMEYCYSVPIEVFNSRPIEDRLREENERLQGIVDGLKRPGMDTLKSYLRFHSHTSQERLIEDMWKRDNEFANLSAEAESLRKRVAELEQQLAKGYPGIAADALRLQIRVVELEGEIRRLAQKFQYTEIYARERAETALNALTPPATEAEAEHE